MDLESLNCNFVGDNDAANMINAVSETKIKEALFDICDNKAPGPDGYSAKFYKSAWSVIGKGVCEAIKEFYRNGKVLGEANATLVTLVTKSKTPLKITDNILLTQEILRGYNWKHGARRAALKIDIQKAYDTVDWDFLENTLHIERVGYFKGGRGLRQGTLFPHTFSHWSWKFSPSSFINRLVKMKISDITGDVWVSRYLTFALQMISVKPT
nr:RNA-directed DNA polymerase, eukaryota, reverse transcriptase zinc-binding domain protein [Tanacetum cinerariifolium]